jgi:hypothetical protein
MSEYNTNNPTDLWSEDEKNSKVENKWVKELKIATRRRVGKVCDLKGFGTQ